jgi:DNA-binding transcriptional MerR regulator
MAARAKKSSAPKRKASARAKSPKSKKPAKGAKAAKSAKAASSRSPSPARNGAPVENSEPVAEHPVLAALPEGKLYYRIGEVSELTEVKAHVLRYWETEFRWMAPPKSRSKQRLYRRKDIEMILAIKRLLYEERYTIAGARQQLRELGLGRAGEAATDNGAQKANGRTPSQEEINAGLLAEELRATYRRLRGELQEIRDLL